jgi:hypothetical protein
LPGNEGKLQQTDIKNELDPAIIDYSKKASAGPNTVGFGYSYILPASLDMPPYLYVENHQVEESPTAYTKGNKEDKADSGEYLHRGIGLRSFTKTLRLADTVEVQGAEYKDGILRIGLVNVIPDHKKPRKIEIGTIPTSSTGIERVRELLNERGNNYETE